MDYKPASGCGGSKNGRPAGNRLCIVAILDYAACSLNPTHYEFGRQCRRRGFWRDSDCDSVALDWSCTGCCGAVALRSNFGRVWQSVVVGLTSMASDAVVLMSTHNEVLIKTTGAQVLELSSSGVTPIDHVLE